MTTQTDHNKLLKKIARERLKPHGIFQSGQSRIFLYDKGWFIIVIEFQPSSFSKGTYLNINVDFNFYPRDYFAYSYGNRESGFEEFYDEEQFHKLINELCDLTIKRVQELELKFLDFQMALKTIKKREKGDSTWDLYENAVLNALTANYDKALNQFKKISKEKCDYDWEIERKQVVDKFIIWLKDPSLFSGNLKKLIHRTRQLKKLPTINLDGLTEIKTTPNSNLPKAGRTWLQKLLGN